MNVAIIPARKNSQRIKNKNIKIFNGKPIIYWSIKSAIRSNLFSEVFVSTDSKKIADLSNQYGAKVLYPRPKKLSDAYTKIIDVIKFEIKNLEDQKIRFDNVCCIFPAAPFIKKSYLKKSLNLLKQIKSKGFVFAANEIKKNNLRSFYFKKDKLNLVRRDFQNTRTQDLPRMFVDSGQFYWGKKKLWLKERSIFIKNSKCYHLPRYKSIDIDNLADWKEAEFYAKKK